jgi:hypothetical protein
MSRSSRCVGLGYFLLFYSTFAGGSSTVIGDAPMRRVQESCQENYLTWSDTFLATLKANDVRLCPRSFGVIIFDLTSSSSAKADDPVNAGADNFSKLGDYWMPAFAGMTNRPCFLTGAGSPVSPFAFLEGMERRGGASGACATRTL